MALLVALSLVGGGLGSGAYAPAVDRRFNRTNYDARQVLEQFAFRVRDQTDLDALSADLLATVDEALQPQRVELWLVSERRQHER